MKLPGAFFKAKLEKQKKSLKKKPPIYSYTPGESNQEIF